MVRVTKAVSHLSEEEIEEKIKRANDVVLVKKYLVVKIALINPQPAKEIGKIVGLAKQTVNNLISAYNRYGEKVLETVGKRGKRNRAYMSLEEEKKFLDLFTEKGKKGELVTIHDLKKAFEKEVGKEVEESTVYRILKRHGWRKIVPRPYHPEVDKEKQGDFKKTLAVKSRKS